MSWLWWILDNWFSLAAVVTGVGLCWDKGPMGDAWADTWRGLLNGWVWVPVFGVVLMIVLFVVWPLQLILMVRGKK